MQKIYLAFLGMGEKMDMKRQYIRWTESVP